MKKLTFTENSLALRLLKVVFSIYLGITLVITLFQMANEYLLEEHFIKDNLIVSQAIFQGNLAESIWNIDDTQLSVTVQGILKQPTLVGIKIIDEYGKDLIKQGQIINKEGKTVLSENNQEQPLSYVILFQHSFDLMHQKRKIGTVTLYSSNQIIFNKVKYNFLVIIVNAVIKTITLWILFIWAFNKFLTSQLDVFCQAVENIDIDNDKECALKLETFQSYELSRIEYVFNDLLKRIIESRDKLNELNVTLEQKVFERTQQLQSAMEVVEQANKKINDSIEYASLIQKAILPTRQLADFLGENQNVVWQPRDVVGGDLYVFHVYEDTYLLGIIDCAGHGVPGALMTMLARATLAQAISEQNISSPAMLLEKMDFILRERLQNAKLSRGLAVSMDAGLVFVDSKQKHLRFAGAKISLYWTDGQQVVEIKGDNRAILGNKRGSYQDVQFPLQANITFCMTSDGILDQAGGDEGFGFGNTQFANLFCQNAHRAIAEQSEIIMNTIHNYRGDYSQRDDITLLLFKPPHKQEFSNAS